MTEQEITIKGCIENNRKSQEKLYLQFYPVLSSLCKRFFDDKQEIVSAINNGMLKVFKNIREYDSSKSELITWIYTIVRNETLTIVRNNKNQVVTTELTDDLAVEIISNPFSQTTEEEVLYYLGKLSNTTRAVCNLFYIDGYAIKEIATSLEMKEGTVKWHLSEGRKKIQSNFSNNGKRIASTG